MKPPNRSLIKVHCARKTVPSSRAGSRRKRLGSAPPGARAPYKALNASSFNPDAAEAAAILSLLRSNRLGPQLAKQTPRRRRLRVGDPKNPSPSSGRWRNDQSTLPDVQEPLEGLCRCDWGEGCHRQSLQDCAESRVWLVPKAHTAMPCRFWLQATNHRASRAAGCRDGGLQTNPGPRSQPDSRQPEVLPPRQEIQSCGSPAPQPRFRWWHPAQQVLQQEN